MALGMAALIPERYSFQNIDVPLRQRSFSCFIDEGHLCFSFDATPAIHLRALALSLASHMPGDWLDVIPSPALGLHLLDQEIRLCLQYWLGSPFLQRGQGSLSAGASLTPLEAVVKRGSYPLSELYPGCSILSSIDNCFSTPEVVAISWPNLACGHFLPNWERGRPTALDVCHFYTATAYLAWCSQCPRAHIESRRRQENGPTCYLMPGCGSVFVPLLVESL